MAGKKEGLREKIAESFIAALEQEKLPWHATWKNQHPYNAVSGKKYRGVNTLWLSLVAEMKGFEDPRWCTFKQAKDKGWSVRKGENGTPLEFWSIYDGKTRKRLDFHEADKIVREDPEREKDMRLLARTYYVFNGAQIEGIPELTQNTVFPNIEAIRGQRDVLLTNMGLGFSEGGNAAFYRPSTDSITMPPDTTFESPYAYMATFLHECGHATGHESRLDRDLTGAFGSESYAKEELRAEIASAFTAQALGFGSSDKALSASMDNHKAYIQSWISVIREKPEELFAAIKDAEKISDYLLERGEFELGEQEQEVVPDLDDVVTSAEQAKESAQEEVAEPVVAQTR